MRFEVNLRFWVESESLEDAEAAITAAQAAAHAALAEAAISNPTSGALYSGDLHGVDDEANAALTEGDLGPGRDWMAFGSRDP